MRMKYDFQGLQKIKIIIIIIIKRNLQGLQII